ncbi:Class I poly(R)-hydroxyalkanoic acid synthase [Candidatus Trichorickettsia mobilis]|uniref:Class I poly(R)-hydroxyalkanoic acid synthase n=1 Tax=Candidatus Trichorickettsia mobilis TaxID=1346319 RepID=A0ABZ0UTA5_9RICK|nr:class I poly(R)-hydroxyalkanoic acid synthase [Candidatus Trichorickettsia mobilis]WPY00746.1 Class I poly(R)-hydroxyalkanoic acid synthase [Candidatus Trichorickettsia mobilis]
MKAIDSDQIIQNLQKICDKYQEVVLYLLQGKGAFIPPSLVNEDKNRLMFTSVSEQFWRNPEKFMQINIDYYEKFHELVSHSITRFSGKQTDPIVIPSGKDKRFKDAAWQENIFFDFVKQFYLLSSEWLQKNIDQYELDLETKRYLEFTTRQFIDAFAPSNSIFYNPEVLRESLETGWQNIVQGLDNLLSDIKKSDDILDIPTTDKSAFQFGKNIAATKGKIVYQNELMQLICYAPKVQTYKIPLLIIPPWINKYYILDLSTHNSMVSFLVENNFQVFMVSWKNPDQKLSHKNFEDYLQEGVLEACHYITSLGFKKINAAGYCIGGTLLATAIAYMKANALDYINSVSFFTTLLDFANPGEVDIFINETSISAIEAEMKLKGYFDGRYLSNSFSLLRANDLVWSFFINNYLLGKTPMPFDLLYWNADHTNLPATMHSYYLRNMYLNNLLRIPNAIQMLGSAIDLSKIDCNSFFLAANDDHIAPWRAVYESAKLLNGNKKFVLTSSGHVAGVINPPATSKYNYRIQEDLPAASEEWLKNSIEFKGSWWIPWKNWLIDNSEELTSSIPYQDIDFIELAPGMYVQQNCL